MTSSSKSDGPFGTNAEIGVGFSNSALLVVSVAGFCMVAVTVYAFVFARAKTREEMEKEEQDDQDYDERLTRADVSTLTRAQRRARARVIMKQHRRAFVPPTEGEGEQAVEQPEDEQQQQALSRKERQRAAKLAEKENRRLFEEERRKQQKEAEMQAQKRRREEARKAEQERQQKKLEKQAQEQKEQSEWETFMSGPDCTLSVQEWTRDLNRERIVDIDEIAAQFSTIQAVVRKRIEKLVQERRVAGVFEGNKFIFVSDTELQAIAGKILEAGSCSLSDVARICNEVVSE